MSEKMMWALVKEKPEKGLWMKKYRYRKLDTTM